MNDATLDEIVVALRRTNEILESLLVLLDREVFPRAKVLEYRDLEPDRYPKFKAQSFVFEPLDDEPHVITVNRDGSVIEQWGKAENRNEAHFGADSHRAVQIRQVFTR